MPTHNPVLITEDTIEVNNLTIADPTAVAKLRAIVEVIDDDITRIFTNCVGVGAQALYALSSGHEVQHLRDTIQHSRTEAEHVLKQLTSAAEDVTSKATETIRKDLKKSLDDLAKDSAILNAIEATLDPSGETSAAGKMVDNIKRASKELAANLLEDAAKLQADQTEVQEAALRQILETLEKMQEAAEKMSGYINRHEESLRGTQQGHDFEGENTLSLGEIARLTGAVLEDTANETGLTPGCKEGDHVLTLPDGVIIAFQDKRESKPMTAKRARTLGEKACENRGADACIIVVDGIDKVPGHQPFAYVDSTLAIVDGSVPYTLQLITQHMAHVVRLRQRGTAAGDIDAVTEELGEHLAKLRGRLKELTTMRTGVSNARKGMDMTTKAIDTLEAQVKDDLAAMEALLESLEDDGDTPLAA